MFVGWKEITNAFFYNLTKNMNAGQNQCTQSENQINCPETVQSVGMWSEANEQPANESGKPLCLLLHLTTNEQLAWVLSCILEPDQGPVRLNSRAAGPTLQIHSPAHFLYLSF